MPARAADVYTTNASNAPERADITDALVQLRLIAHIEKRSRSEVCSSRAAAQSAALAEEVEASVPETSRFLAFAVSPLMASLGVS